MQPDRATKRADCHEAAGAAKHDGEASDKPGQSQSMPGRSQYDVQKRNALSLPRNKRAITFVQINCGADA